MTSLSSVRRQNSPASGRSSVGKDEYFQLGLIVTHSRSDSDLYALPERLFPFPTWI